MPCIDTDTPLSREELHDRAVNLVALVRHELVELAIELAALAALGDEAADHSRKIRERVTRDLAGKLQQFDEMIIIE
jgi:hypothetical protein